jgi:hypothetical protein
MNAIINIGTLIPFAISISDSIKNAQNADFSSVYVEIGAGTGVNGTGTFGGAVPAISIWNEEGARLGQYMPSKNEKIAAGTSNHKPINVLQNQGATGQPEYIQLTTVNNDAICITYVTVSGNGVSWTWMGDIGYTCNGDWYPSVAKFGSDNYQPKCTWIDADHSDNLRFIAMSMHMPDFNGDSALISEYNENHDYLCNSKARFMQWGKLTTNPGYNQEPPMFKPPLQYNDDGSDQDLSALFTPGTVTKRSMSSANNSSLDGSINRPGHVIISDYKAHSASEVCGSETSRGPSFVSTQEGIYCDMSTKISYPLCSPTVTNGCFDVDTMELIGNRRHHARDLEAREVYKRYKTSDRWIPDQ